MSEKLPFAAVWMALEILIASDLSQTKNDGYHNTAYMQNLKSWYRWTYLQKELELEI